MTKKAKQTLVEDQTTPRNIYQKLHHIQSKIGQLEKTRENKYQKYFYAGEYDLLKVIKPLLAEQQLLLIFSDEIGSLGKTSIPEGQISETHPFWKEQLGKEWLVHYLKKAQLINAQNNTITFELWLRILT